MRLLISAALLAPTIWFIARLDRSGSHLTFGQFGRCIAFGLDNQLGMARTNVGRDLQAIMMAGGTNLGVTGTFTSTTATSGTDSGATFPTSTDSLAGRIVVSAGVYGVIISNTGTALTVDRWNNPATPGGSAGTTPGNVAYVVLPAVMAFMFMGLSANASPSSSDTALTSEITTASGGLIRKICPYAHTASASTWTQTPVFTANGSDSLPVTVASIGMFNTVKGATGVPIFTTSMSATATLASSGDQLTVTETTTGA